MNQRKRKIIEPRLQYKAFGLFFMLAALAALTQSLVSGYLLQEVATRLPNDGLELRTSLGSVLAKSYLITFMLLAPVMLTMGIRSTFKVLGPLHRFRVHLRQIVDGEHPAACRIRKDDELQDLCELLNDAVDTLRGQAAGAAEESTPSGQRQAEPTGLAEAGSASCEAGRVDSAEEESAAR